MNILGINGALGWDGNISGHLGGPWLFRVHGSGATLIMDGELKNAINEESFSRIKYDGNYPELSIQNILDHNGLTKHDIDLVVYVGGGQPISFELMRGGYTKEKLQEYFPNSEVEFLSHHSAHTAATFYTSDFLEANILSFDGAGDYEVQKDEQWLLSHWRFSQGKDLTLTEISSRYHNIENHISTYNPPQPWKGFGLVYSYYSWIIYAIKMKLKYDAPVNKEIFPGKVMGLAAFGDYQKINLPDIFKLELEDGFPQLYNSLRWANFPEEVLLKLNPEDLAAWSQHQFEKYLLLYLSNIPKEIKSDNLCLGGGCALNILANSKIIEQGIYKNVHVNTAPNDDGLHFGAALYKAIEHENKITLPNDIGYLGITYTDEDIERALDVR